MDFICYDHNVRMIARFNTKEEGIAWIDKQTAQFRSYGLPAPGYRLCYNGIKSVEVYNNRTEKQTA